MHILFYTKNTFLSTPDIRKIKNTDPLTFSEHSEKAKSKPRVAFDPDEVKKDERKIQEETKSRLETIGRLAEERKLLESQMDLERRRLEREQEALKKEAEKLEAEKKKFEEEKRKQVTLKKILK
jgi:hypothetical protein